MRISISVPNPCHENWNAMAPATAGRHCDKCQHTVMDLTQASDRQLIDLFRADAMPKCARFTQGQLDRVIALEERSARLLPAAAVGAAMAIGAPAADAQNCTPTVGKMAITRPVDLPQVGQMMVEPLKDPASENSGLSNMAITGDTIATEIDLHEMGEVEVRGGRVAVVPHGLFVAEPHDTLTGRVLDHDGSPLPFANVRVRGTELQAVTDEEGRYTIALLRSISSERCTLLINAMGYSTREVQVPAFGNDRSDDSCPYNPGAPLTGRVTWADGQVARNIEVVLVEHGTRCSTDSKGRFSFDHPASDAGGITIVATDKLGAMSRAKTKVGALPCCVSITLPGADPAPEVHATHIDLGDAALEEAEVMVLGEWAGGYVPAPTLLARMARPFRWVGERVGNALR